MRTVKTEFPDYDGELPYIAGYEDTSWHNDTCPSIEKDYGNGVRVRVWCDYVDPEKRQNPEYKRFAIVAYSPTDEDGSTLLSTDSFHLVIERIAQYEASMSIPPLELAKAFCAQLLKSLPNPFDNLAEINHRNAVFEADGDHSTCATHDFCDANQVMLDAIESICGVADYHFAQNEMINAAWDIARKARFDADKCCEPVKEVPGPFVLVYESSLTTCDCGYGEMMVYRDAELANKAVTELAKIGVFVEVAPLFPIERLTP